MKELLVFGDVTKDFERNHVEIRETYKGNKYSVCEVTEAELERLNNEPDDADYWINCGFRSSYGSNMCKPNYIVKVKGKSMKVWKLDLHDPPYSSLLDYIEKFGAWMDDNICSLCVHLANANNMKLSELFKIYEG